MNNLQGEGAYIRADSASRKATSVECLFSRVREGDSRFCVCKEAPGSRLGSVAPVSAGSQLSPCLALEQGGGQARGVVGLRHILRQGAVALEAGAYTRPLFSST
jgi:hypothetical protein